MARRNGSYGSESQAKAQSTAVRLENALREAMLEDVRMTSTSASSSAIASKKLATLRKLLDRATRELVRRCLHPSEGLPASPGGVPEALLYLHLGPTYLHCPVGKACASIRPAPLDVLV